MKSKKTLLVLLATFMVCAIQSNAQTLTMKDGKFHHSDGTVLQKSELSIVFKDYPQASHLLSEHYAKFNKAKVYAAISGLSLAGILYMKSQVKSGCSKDINCSIDNGMAAFGLLVLSGYGLSKAIRNVNAGNRKLKESIISYNDHNNFRNKEQNRYILAIGLKGNEIGLSYTF